MKGLIRMKCFFRLLFSWFGLFMAELLILFLSGATTIPWYCKIALIVAPVVITIFREDD